MVSAVSVAGNLIVTFEAYGTQQEVKLGEIREATGGGGAGTSAYRGKRGTAHVTAVEVQR